MSYLFTHNFPEPNIYSCFPRLSCICWLYSSRHPSWTGFLLSREQQMLQWPTLKNEEREGSHTKWRESVLLYYVGILKVKDLKRNPAGFYFGHRVGVGWVDEPSEARGKHFQGTGKWRSVYYHDMRTLYCKCSLNVYPYTPFVVWTFIITRLCSSGENKQYTCYRFIL